VILNSLEGNSSSYNTAGVVEFPSSPSAGLASPSAGGAGGASSFILLLFVLLYFKLGIFYFKLWLRLNASINVKQNNNINNIYY